MFKRINRGPVSYVVVLAIVAACSSTPVPPQATAAPTAVAGFSPSPIGSSTATDGATNLPTAAATIPGATATNARPGTPAGSAPPTAVPATPGATEQPTPAPTGTSSPSEPPAAVILPPGMQYEQGEKLPANFSWGGPQVGADGTLYVLASRSAKGSGGVDQAVPYLGIRAPGHDWEVVRIDDNKHFAAPRGYPLNREGLGPSSLVIGPNGFVGFGATDFWTPGFYSATSLGIVQTSRDGRNWKRTDLRTILGASRSVGWGRADRTDTGYVIAVATSNLAQSTKSEISVLTSADGSTWKKAATVHGERWSVSADGVQVLADGRWLLSGTEWACETNSQYFATFNVGGMLRYWTSADQGRTWQPFELAAGLVTAPEPNPSAATCRALKDPYNERQARFATTGGILGFVDGTAVAIIGANQAQAATSRDLQTWTIGDLPGAVPTGRSADSFEARGRNTVFAYDGGIALLSSQSARRPDNTSALIEASQFVGWHTVDGQTWTMYPLPIPLAGKYGFAANVGQDGVARYIEKQEAAPGTPAGTYLYTSSAGPLKAWGNCTPGPGADCRFTELADFDGTGINAPGLDFSGGRITGSNFSGADLSGGNFAGIFFDATLTNANLSDINGRGINLRGDLTGANFDGANLTNAFTNASFLNASFGDAVLRGVTVFLKTGQSVAGADLSGLDLKGISFNALGTDAPVNMRDVNFANADLDGASFSRVDLTGANFHGASTTGIYFSQDSICPSGKPVQGPQFYTYCPDVKA